MFERRVEMTQQTSNLPAAYEAIVETLSERRDSSMSLVAEENEIRAKAAKLAGVPFPSKGYAETDHSDFLDKVRKALGADADKFSGTYRDSANREQPCYYLPKRESCFMAMSYSYTLGCQVFDRWQELETQLAQLSADAALLQRLPAPEMQAVWDASLRVTQTQMLNLTNARAKKAMIQALQNNMPLGGTPEQIAVASLEFYNKNAAKFLKMAQPDAKESVRQLRLSH